MHRPRRATPPIAMAALMLIAACGGSSTAAKDTGATKPAPSTPTATPTASPTASPNGIEALSAKQILKRAVKASSTAPSAHLSGGCTEGGDRITMDLRLSARAATGKLTMNGQTSEVIRLGSVIDFKADRAFWRANFGKNAAILMAGKYFRTTTKNKQTKPLADLMFLPKIIAVFAKPGGTISRRGIARINGRPAVPLHDSSGGDLYVAAEGEPYILRVTAPGGDARLEFGGYGEAVTAQAPPRDQVVDTDKLPRA